MYKIIDKKQYIFKIFDKLHPILIKFRSKMKSNAWVFLLGHL